MSRSDLAIAVLCGIVVAGIYKAADSNYRKTRHLLVLVDQARIVAETFPSNDEAIRLGEFAERAATEFNLDREED